MRRNSTEKTVAGFSNSRGINETAVMRGVVLLPVHHLYLKHWLEVNHLEAKGKTRSASWSAKRVKLTHPPLDVARVTVAHYANAISGEMCYDLLNADVYDFMPLLRVIPMNTSLEKAVFSQKIFYSLWKRNVMTMKLENLIALHRVRWLKEAVTRVLWNIDHKCWQSQEN